MCFELEYLINCSKGKWKGGRKSRMKSKVIFCIKTHKICLRYKTVNVNFGFDSQRNRKKLATQMFRISGYKKSLPISVPFLISKPGFKSKPKSLKCFVFPVIFVVIFPLQLIENGFKIKLWEQSHFCGHYACLPIWRSEFECRWRKSVYFVNCLKIAAKKSCAYLKKHYALFAQKTNSSCFLENWLMIKTLVIDLMQVVA